MVKERNPYGDLGITQNCFCSLRSLYMRAHFSNVFFQFHFLSYGNTKTKASLYESTHKQVEMSVMKHLTSRDLIQ